MQQRPAPPPDITGALARWRDGDATAFNQLLPLIYDTLRDIARRQRARNAHGALDTTALVHEAYLSLVERSPGSFPDRARFYGYVGCTMRSLLVDAARREQARKRGGDYELVPIVDELGVPAPQRVDELLAVDSALNQLGAADAELLAVVELRFFVGMPVPEVADVLGISPRSVDRLWQKARLVLGMLL